MGRDLNANEAGGAQAAVITVLQENKDRAQTGSDHTVCRQRTEKLENVVGAQRGTVAVVRGGVSVGMGDTDTWEDTWSGTVGWILKRKILDAHTAWCFS